MIIIIPIPEDGDELIYRTVSGITVRAQKTLAMIFCKGILSLFLRAQHLLQRACRRLVQEVNPGRREPKIKDWIHSGSTFPRVYFIPSSQVFYAH